MQVATFRVKCEGCGKHFVVSQLPDMSYGIFLYYTTDGKTVTYYEAIDDPVWRLVESIVQEVKPVISADDQGEIVRRVIGFLADSPSKETHFTTNIICPNCQSAVQTVDTSQKIRTENLEALTFNDFNSLTKPQKKEKISMVIENLQTR